MNCGTNRGRGTCRLNLTDFTLAVYCPPRAPPAVSARRPRADAGFVRQESFVRQARKRRRRHAMPPQGQPDPTAASRAEPHARGPALRD